MTDATVTEFASLGLSISHRPVPILVARQVSAALTAFMAAKKAALASGQDLDVRNEEASDFLVEQAYNIILTVYIGSNQDMLAKVGTLSTFTALTTIDEVLSFWAAQGAANGPRDFLLKPVIALAENLGKFGVALDKATAKAMEDLANGVGAQLPAGL